MSALQFLREKAGVLVAGLIGLSLLFSLSPIFSEGEEQQAADEKTI